MVTPFITGSASSQPQLLSVTRLPHCDVSSRGGEGAALPGAPLRLQRPHMWSLVLHDEQVVHGERHPPSTPGVTKAKAHQKQLTAPPLLDSPTDTRACKGPRVQGGPGRGGRGGRGWRDGGWSEGHTAPSWSAGFSTSAVFLFSHTILQPCSSTAASLPRPPAQGHPHQCWPRGTVLLLVQPEFPPREQNIKIN